MHGADIRKVKKSNKEFNSLTLHRTVAESFQNILDDDVCFESPSDMSITSNVGLGHPLYNARQDLQKSPQIQNSKNLFAANSNSNVLPGLMSSPQWHILRFKQGDCPCDILRPCVLHQVTIKLRDLLLFLLLGRKAFALPNPKCSNGRQWSNASGRLLGIWLICSRLRFPFCSFFLL